MTRKSEPLAVRSTKPFHAAANTNSRPEPSHNGAIARPISEPMIVVPVSAPLAETPSCLSQLVRALGYLVFHFICPDLGRFVALGD
jgi:hypothetical protein